MSMVNSLGTAPSGSLSQKDSFFLSIAISGLWSIDVSLANAPAGSSPVRAVPSKMPVCGPVSLIGTCT